MRWREFVSVWLLMIGSGSMISLWIADVFIHLSDSLYLRGALGTALFFLASIAARP